MGRNIPPGDITTTTTIHPLLSLAISVAWIAALVATISSLCGIWSKKTFKSSTKSDMKNTGIITPDTSRGNFPNSADNKANTTTTEDDEITTKPLPPPPSATTLEFGESTIVGNKKKMDKSSSLKNYMSKASTRKKLSFSMSMRMSTKIKDKASDFKGKASEFKDKASDYRKAKNDSGTLWNKRIILGEKCRRPNEEDQLSISNDNAQVGSQTHSRTTSRSLSNSSLSIDHDSNSSLSEDEKLSIEQRRKGKHKVTLDE